MIYIKVLTLFLGRGDEILFLVFCIVKEKRALETITENTAFPPDF